MDAGFIHEQGGEVFLKTPSLFFAAPNRREEALELRTPERSNPCTYPE
ncbi:hypothetical protein SAMN05216581_0419 [Pseudomonas asplenii]|uniref:Uncharacterized protein n=1 Tax=Pseudomonas asplenii TaxID=53407 RepID=A0A1H6LNR9_9PSED|nr:hypothetical protein SAMN05216581_0419 [Pseudomonas fuscovaginae]